MSENIVTNNTAHKDSTYLKHLQGLNNQQREAVECIQGPVLIVAGAGTGKTRTLTARMAHLIWLGLAQPYEILAVTFTNRAANELRERIHDLTGVDHLELSWVGTFHSMSAKILRLEAGFVGLSSNLTILNDDDQLKIIKGLLKAENIDEKKWPASVLSHKINRWKDDAKSPVDLNEREAQEFNGKAQELYKKYQEILRVSNCADFGDLILHVVNIFASEIEILARYQDRIRFVIVDEYQDTNIAQYKLLRLLTQKHHNICCVGDDDQAIYSWRGARPQIMLGFESHYPGAKVIRLEQNYRSTKHILGAAVALIKNNYNRHAKSLRVADGAHGESAHKIDVYCLPDNIEEAQTIAREIKYFNRKHDDKQYRYNEIAIAARAWSQLAEIEQALVHEEIPYRVVGGPRFYDRKEIRDALAYMKLCSNPADGSSFERIINTPVRGIGQTSILKIRNLAIDNKLPMLEAARSMLDTGKFSSRPATGIRTFLKYIERWTNMLNGHTIKPRDIETISDSGSEEWASERVSSESLGSLVAKIVEDSGLNDFYRLLDTEDAQFRLDNLIMLAEFADRHASMDEFLEHVGLMSEEPATKVSDSKNVVTLMTLHAAKGSEYPVMFLVAWEEGQLPWRRSIEESGGIPWLEADRMAYFIASDDVDLVRSRGSQLWVLADEILKQYNKNFQERFPSAVELAEIVVHSESFDALRNNPKAKDLARQILNRESLEEERRLAHVGITRAMERCIITHVRYRRIFNRSERSFPSRFIGELPDSDLKTIMIQSHKFSNFGQNQQQWLQSYRYKQQSSNRSTSPLTNSAHGRSHSSACDSEQIVSQQRAKPLGSIANEGFKTGGRIRHRKYGLGTIQSASSNHLFIKFDSAGNKMVLAEYVKPVTVKN